MAARAWPTGILLLFFLGRLASAAYVPSCPKDSTVDAIFGFRDQNCPLYYDPFEPFDFIGVTEGNEVSLQKALNMVYKNTHDYVAVLFYASWCPFSRSFRPSFSVVASLYPSIPHFAIEESSVRPSILSKYGVHGFPTIFLLNSTMRVRYQGSRTLDSLVAFYSDITGVKTASLDKTHLDKIKHHSSQDMHNSIEPETCPFSWARSPENMLRQETYLALATAFVLSQLLYILYPTLLVLSQFTWRRLANMRFRSLLEHPLAYLKRVQLFSSLKEPCKRSNLQEGAMNARAWASKSLASVSIGDASSSRGVPLSECR